MIDMARLYTGLEGAVHDRGDRWVLLRGDSLDILRQLQGPFDALVTDPPYSSGGFTRGDRSLPAAQKYTQSGSSTGALLPGFDGDNRDQRSFMLWCSIWLGLAGELMARGSPGVTFTDWRQLPITADAFQSGGWVWRGLGTWAKTCPRPQMGRFAAACEYIVWGSWGPMRPGEDIGCVPGWVSSSTVPYKSRQHLTEKPVDVMRWAVRICRPGGVVLDPFAGAGSTGVAALESGRRFVGIERQAAYLDTAAARLRQAEGDGFQAGLFAAGGS